MGYFFNWDLNLYSRTFVMIEVIIFGDPDKIGNR